MKTCGQNEVIHSGVLVVGNSACLSQARRQREIIQAAAYARAQELSRSLIAQQENRALADWERQRELRQHTALREAEVGSGRRTVSS